MYSYGNNALFLYEFRWSRLNLGWLSSFETFFVVAEYNQIIITCISRIWTCGFKLSFIFYFWFLVKRIFIIITGGYMLYTDFHYAAIYSFTLVIVKIILTDLNRWWITVRTYMHFSSFHKIQFSMKVRKAYYIQQKYFLMSKNELLAMAKYVIYTKQHPRQDKRLTACIKHN